MMAPWRLGRKELLWETSVKVREKRTDGNRTLKEMFTRRNMHASFSPIHKALVLWQGRGQVWGTFHTGEAGLEHFNCSNEMGEGLSVPSSSLSSFPHLTYSLLHREKLRLSDTHLGA